jgi:hypothetical protein
MAIQLAQDEQMAPSTLQAASIWTPGPRAPNLDMKYGMLYQVHSSESPPKLQEFQNVHCLKVSRCYIMLPVLPHVVLQHTKIRYHTTANTFETLHF